MKFDRISLEEGLSQSTVNTIVQDGQGFLWFGTQDGLNRYDGYTIRVYKHMGSDSGSISDNGIWSLCRDVTGDLWVGTMGGGLNRYSLEHDHFVHHMHDPLDSTSLSDNHVTAVFVDSKGNLWAGTLNAGLNRLDRSGDGFIRYMHNPVDSTTLSNNTVWSICEDRDGAIWVGTWGGLNRLDPSVESSGRFVRYRSNPQDPKSLSSDNVRSVTVDRDGVVWVGTWGGGLNRFDGDSGGFRRYSHEPPSPGSLRSDYILSLAVDRGNVLWVGTGDGGLDRLERLSESFIHYQTDQANLHSLSDNIVCSIYEDMAGTLWIGTGAGGVNRYDWLKNRFSHYRDNRTDPADMSGNDVWAILEDSRGDLWIGTYGEGLNRLDRKRNRYTVYRHDPGDPHSLGQNSVLALCESRDGYLWVGTEGGGLNRLDPRTMKFRRYLHDSRDPGGIIHDEITVIREDRRGFLWVGTNGTGLERFDPSTEQFYHYFPDPASEGSLSSGTIMSIYEDRSGDIWIGTWGGGVHQYHWASDTFTRYRSVEGDSTGLNNNTVLSIYEDKSGVLWFGTQGGGLNRFDRSTGTFAYFTEADGVPNNVVYAILPDRHGNLWLSTNRGLSRFNPQAREFRNYDISDGLQGNEFNQGSFHLSRGGEMFVGGINGFNAFFPDSIRDNPDIPPVYLTEFRVFDKPVPLEYAISATHELELSYAQNFFSFEFVALNYSSPEKNEYAYKLDGLDKDWIHAGTRRYASYTNLDPGAYVFRVKASNNDGLWNEDGIRIAVSITPPYWRTWWFALIVTASIMAVAILLYRLRVKKLLEIERIRASIATDLHDDIGSTLTEVALFSDVGLRELRSHSGDGRINETDVIKVSALLKEIGTTSRSVIDAMNDIVWAIDPKNDSFEFLLLRMKNHAGRVLEAKDINYEITIPDEISHLRLPLAFRRRIFLIFKEAINNILRHAQPKTVTLTINKERRQLLMTITDDGAGFDPAQRHQGNGLRNMKERAASMNGELAIVSAPASGTTVNLRAPIP
ncbi:MAG: two-component regulator propeller domain-containing protein [Bacteroidota bacterium]